MTENIIMIEDQFITAILESKIELTVLESMNFDTTWLRENGNIFEFILNYTSQHDTLPSKELVETRYPIFRCVDVKDDPAEIIEAIRKNSELDRWNRVFRQGNKLLIDSGDGEKIRSFIEKSLEKLTPHTKFVHDITSESFQLGTNDYAKRRLAFETGGVYGIPTGFGKEMDSYFNGGYQPGLYGLIGKSGVSKTWLELVSGLESFKTGQTPYILALEGSVREYHRIITIWSQLSNSGIQAGRVPIMDYMDVEKSIRDYAKEKGNHFYLEFMGDQEIYTPSDLRRNIRKYKPSIVFIDYLTLMRKEKGLNNYADFLDISQEVAMIASRYSIPIVCILQGVISNAEMSMESIATSKGMARDFDRLLGIKRSDGKKYFIDVVDVKARDGESEFKARYQTNWDNGKVGFLEYITDDGAFDL